MSTVPSRLQALERFAPLAGVLAVILWVAGVVISESGGTPNEDAGGQLLANHYDENSATIIGGAFVFMLGVAVFIWFLGGLRERVHWSEGGAGRLASVVFGAGLVIAAMSMGFVAPEAAAAFASDELSRRLEPGAAEALFVLGDGFFIAAEAAAAVFFLAAGLVALRSRALPTWLGWVSIVFGVAAILPWVGWAVYIWGLPLWVLAVSIWMFMRPVSPDRADTRSATATI
jgi:hypothetical protein